MSYELTGKLHKVFEIQSKSETFQTREFVVATDGQYPQYIKFQLTQDRCGAIDNHKEGDEVKVSFDLRGREWNEKFFTNLNAWKIEVGAPQAAPSTPPADSSFPTEEPKVVTNDDQVLDDLPF